MTSGPRISPAAVLFLLGGSVAGCSHPATQGQMLADLDHLPGDQSTEGPVTNGAIYQGNVQGGGGLELFRDHRVWQVGDIVTVQIAQNATATKNVSQNLGRNDSVQSTVNNLFGLPTNFGHSSKTTQFNPNIDYTSANTLQGSDEMKLVGGKEYIRIAGVVRPEDLSGNIVSSTQIAEAHIEFSGDGETYLAPKMGFLQKLFLTVSTAWPGDWFN